LGLNEVKGSGDRLVELIESVLEGVVLTLKVIAAFVASISLDTG
jgi:hypothetical protein